MRCPRFLQKEISHVHRLVWLDPIVRRSQSDFQFRSIKASIIGTRGRVQWLIFASKVASKLSYIASDRMKDSIRRVFSWPFKNCNAVVAQKSNLEKLTGPAPALLFSEVGSEATLLWRRWTGDDSFSATPSSDELLKRLEWTAMGRGIEGGRGGSSGTAL